MAAVSEYDAFVSYSRKNDSVLGPALQAGLERFAKPWYRMRALRVFRDTANLAANPALWASIEDALGSSRWFILLASADAAKSEWVNREVRWWLAHRSPDHLLIVATSPGLARDERGKDWVADAPVPPALRGAFTAEPLWVHLSNTQLGSRGPVFPADRVAAVAAPIRGMPKDMLIGEHLREHRRAMRLARSAVAVLAVLTALAVVASLVAINQRDTAIRQRDQAIGNQVFLEVSQFPANASSLAAQLDIVADQLNPTRDSQTRLVDAASRPLSSPLTGPASSVSSVAFSPDGKIVAAAGGSGGVLLWTLTNPAHPTPLGRPLTAPPTSNCTLLLSVSPRSETGSAKTCPDDFSSVAFSPDGTILAAGSTYGQVWLWNLRNPAHPVSLGHPLAGPTSSVSSVAFSPDGTILAANDQDNIRLWSMGNPAHPMLLGRPLADPAGSIESMAFSPSGKILATGDFYGKSRLWSLTSPAHPFMLGSLPTGPTASVSSVEFSPDGKILAMGTNQSVWLWSLTDTAHPALLGRSLTGPTAAVDSVAFSPDGKVLAADGEDDDIWLWNLANPGRPIPLGQPVPSPAVINSLAFSPDGTILATAGDDGAVRLWSLPSNVLSGPTASVDSVAFSPDGKILAAADGDDMVLALEPGRRVPPRPDRHCPGRSPRTRQLGGVQPGWQDPGRWRPGRGSGSGTSRTRHSPPGSAAR